MAPNKLKLKTRLSYVYSDKFVMSGKASSNESGERKSEINYGWCSNANRREEERCIDDQENKGEWEAGNTVKRGGGKYKTKLTSFSVYHQFDKILQLLKILTDSPLSWIRVRHWIHRREGGG